MANAYREMKRRARLQLHEAMSEPVWFFETAESVPVATTVRFHFKFDALGMLPGKSSVYAEREEEIPKMIFLAGLRPKRHGLVVTEDLGVYWVDHDLPPDDITVTVEVRKLTPSEVTAQNLDPNAPWAGLPAPALS